MQANSKLDSSAKGELVIQSISPKQAPQPLTCPSPKKL
jgi:hypothetical protein